MRGAPYVRLTLKEEGKVVRERWWPNHDDPSSYRYEVDIIENTEEDLWPSA